MKRRELLQQLAITGTLLAPPAAISGSSGSDRLGSVLPKRTLGKCGEKVTCLGLGGFHIGWPEDEALKAQQEGKGKWTSDNPVVPGSLSVEECISFTLSLPVSVLITGAEKPEYVEEKASMVRRFSALSAEQRLALADKVADFAGEGKVEYYKNKDLRLPTAT